MKRRWRPWLALLLLLLLVSSLLLVPSVRWHVYGWLKGEAFYQGKPTSYWRERILSHLEARATGAMAFEVPWIVGVMDDLGIPVSFENPLEWPDVLRPDEPAAVPVLVELLTTDDDGLWRALDAASDRNRSLLLDAIGTKGVQEVLRELAKGDEGARLTRAAKAVLERLAKSSPQSNE
jgi:hypothetical protein